MFLVVINFSLINCSQNLSALAGLEYQRVQHDSPGTPHSDQYQISPNNITVISVERSRERMKSLALMKCPDV